MFYNTPINTYIWILSNRKSADKKGKVLLMNARKKWQKMRKSLGDKRRYLSEEDISMITSAYGNYQDNNEDTGIFSNTIFEYKTITIERPLKNKDQMLLKEKNRRNATKPDGKLRDTENVPAGKDIDEYFRRDKTTPARIMDRQRENQDRL